MAQKDVDFILSDVIPALRTAGLTTHVEAIKAVLREGAAPPDAAFLPEVEPEPVSPPIDPVIGTADPSNPIEPAEVEPIVKDHHRHKR